MVAFITALYRFIIILIFIATIFAIWNFVDNSGLFYRDDRFLYKLIFICIDVVIFGFSFVLLNINDCLEEIRDLLTANDPTRNKIEFSELNKNSVKNIPAPGDSIFDSSKKSPINDLLNK